MRVKLLNVPVHRKRGIDFHLGRPFHRAISAVVATFLTVDFRVDRWEDVLWGSEFCESEEGAEHFV